MWTRMAITKDKQVGAEVTEDEKRQLNIDASKEGRYMKDVAGEAIALYVAVPDELVEELGCERKGEVISHAVNQLIEEHDID